MIAYFDRTLPFYLTDKPTFYGTAVEVDETVVQNAKALRKLQEDVVSKIHNSASPERANQGLCDYYAEELRKICKTRKQDNRRNKDGD